MLAFVPSYSLLEEMTATWHRTRIRQAHLSIVGASPQGPCPLLGLTLQDPISSLMPCVEYEPRGGAQEAFDCARRDFARGVSEHGRALLVAVCRGKMSEGLSFADNLAVCPVSRYLVAPRHPCGRYRPRPLLYRLGLMLARPSFLAQRSVVAVEILYPSLLATEVSAKRRHCDEQGQRQAAAAVAAAQSRPARGRSPNLPQPPSQDKLQG